MSTPQNRFDFINAPPATEAPPGQRDFSFINEPDDVGDAPEAALRGFYDDVGLKHGAVSGILDTFVEGALALGDVLPGGDPFNPIDVASGVVRDIGAFSGQALSHPIQTSKAIITGIVQPMVIYPIELLTNYNIGEGRELTDDERYSRARMFTANAVGWAVGMGVRGAAKRAITGQAAVLGKTQLRGLEKLAKFEDELRNRGAIQQGLSELDTRQLYALRNTARIPAYGRRMAAGMAEGAAGGFATGYLEGTTLEERLQAGIAYSLIAMPLGVAMETGLALFKRKGPEVSDIIAEEAGALSHLRQINHVFNQTPAELAVSLDALIQTGSIPAALARRHIQYDVAKLDETGLPVLPGRNAAVIPSVADPSVVLNQITNIEGQPQFEPMIHPRPDGTFDILLSPLGQMDDATKNFFTNTGFVPGQQVSFQGSNDYYISTARVSHAGRTRTVEDISARMRELAEGGSRRGGPRAPRVELTRISDGEKLDVQVRKLGRPGTVRYGDLMVYQRRSVTTDDIFEPGQGFTPEGPNMVRPTGFSTGDPAHFQSLITKMVQSHDGTSVSFADAQAKIASLTPGVHQFINKAGNGLVLYMGGMTVKRKVPIGEGAFRTIDTNIGEPGQIVGIFEFDEKVHPHTQQKMRGSVLNVMLDKTVLGEDARKALSIVNAETRKHTGALKSWGSLSQGAAPSLARFTNKYNPQVDPQKFGFINPEVFAADALDAFYSYIGFDGDDARINPDEVISNIGYDNPITKTYGDPDSGVHSYLYNEGEPIIARPGETQEAFLRKLYPGFTNKLDRDPSSVRYFSESKKQYTKEEAIRILEEQNKKGDVPTSRTENAFPADRTHVSFNDLFNSFVTESGLNPEHAAPLRNFFEREMARELLGMSSRKRSVDMRSTPWLEERVRNHDEAITKLTDFLEDMGGEELTTPYVSSLVSRAMERPVHFKTVDEIQGALAELKHHRDVFNNRLEIMKEAAPEPFKPEEQEVLKRLIGEATKMREVAANDLVSVADSHGFMVETSGGMIKLRNTGDGSFHEVPRAFASVNDAMRWIETGNEALGIDLDGGGNNTIPPGAIGGGAAVPPGPPVRGWETPYEFPKDARISQVMQWFDSVVPWATTKRGFFTAIDNKFGTKLFGNIFLPLQMTKMRLEASKRPALERLQSVEKLIVDSKISPERMEVVNRYRRTRAAGDVINSVYSDRVMTNTEIGYAQHLAEGRVDAPRVYEYLRKFEKLEDRYQSNLKQVSNDPDGVAQLETLHKSAIEKLNQAFNMDQPHLEAAALFRKVRAGNPDDAKLFGIVRLMESYKNGELDKTQFAAVNEMTDAELAAAKAVDEQWQAIANDIGVDSRIEDFLANFASSGAFEGSGRVSPHLKDAAKRGVKEALPEDVQDFAFDMIRNGEINVYDTDPLRQLVQFTNAGFNNRGFNAQWKQAFKTAEAELKKMPTGSNELAARVTNEYLYGLKGFKASADVLMQESVQKTLEGLNIKLNIDVTRDYVNTVLAAQSGAMLGFRPMQGIRDFHGFIRNYYTRFGLQRTKRAFELGFTRGPDGKLPMRTLAESGEIPGLGIIEFLTNEELANAISGKTTGTLKSMIFKSSKAGLELSGQSTAYGIAHAMAFTETMSRSADVFKRLSENKITKVAAYKELALNSYDVPFGQHIDELVTQGKFEDAARTLAHETGAETAFMFGLSNHPLGWSTNIGRLLSQFGTWSVHARDFIRRAAGRGTGRERAAAIARFTSSEVALGLGGAALGFNVRAWYMLPGVLFLGGPALSRIQQMEELVGLRGSSRKNIAEMELEIYNGKVPFISEFIPGSYAFSDYLRSYDLMQRGFNPLTITGRALGFNIRERDRSLVDELLGNYPR